MNISKDFAEKLCPKFVEPDPVWLKKIAGHRSKLCTGHLFIRYCSKVTNHRSQIARGAGYGSTVTV